MKLWNVADRWQMVKSLFPPHYDGVTDEAVSRKTSLFYSVSRDKTIKVWNAATLENEIQVLS